MAVSMMLLALGVLCGHHEPARADNPSIYPQARHRQHFPGPPPAPVPLAKWSPPYPYGWFGVVRGKRSLYGSQTGYHNDWRELQFSK